MPARAEARSPKISFYFGLERPEPRARKAFHRLADPGSDVYRSFLGARQAARRFGARRPAVKRLRRQLRRRGLRIRLDRSRVFARVSGRAGRFERAFGVRIRRTFNNDVNAYAYFPAGEGRLRLPRRMRPLVREVVATYTRSAPRGGGGASIAAPAGADSGPSNEGTWIGGCEDARATGSYSFAQVREAYGADAPGSGGSVAIVNVGEGIPAGDIAAAAACFDLPRIDARTLLSDGQRRRFGRGSFEPQEDLALVRGMAPGLEAVTFSQAWPAPELWFLGVAGVFAAPSLPDTLSISYGECERDIRGKRAIGPATRAGARLLDSLLIRLGIAGVGAFASAGDFGSTCNGRPFPGVAWPASSPYLTAAGGTRLVLDHDNERSDEVVWNDLRWTSAAAGGGAGGGGFSLASRRPPYQRGLELPGSRRAVPDVSAHASMFPGWPVVLAGNWVADGGTSASAPLLAGAFAAISARERAAGAPPLGPVNGMLYARQGQQPAAFFDVVRGANRYSPKAPGLRALPGYDRASGLGVPRFDRLAAELPPPTG